MSHGKKKEKKKEQTWQDTDRKCKHFAFWLFSVTSAFNQDTVEESVERQVSYQRATFGVDAPVFVSEEQRRIWARLKERRSAKANVSSYSKTKKPQKKQKKKWPLIQVCCNWVWRKSEEQIESPKEIKNLLGLDWLDWTGLDWAGPDRVWGLSGPGLSCRPEYEDRLVAGSCLSRILSPWKWVCQGQLLTRSTSVAVRARAPCMCRCAACRVKTVISPLWGWYRILLLLLKPSGDKRGIWDFCFFFLFFIFESGEQV